MKNFLQIICLGILVVSCAAKKTAQDSSTAKLPTTAVSSSVNNKSFYSNVLKPLAFDEVKISSKINVESDQFIPGVNGTFYIENGKKIWVNLSALLFNVARGIATPTGIKGYEKIKKTYIDSDFGYINNLLKVNFIDYYSLQNLLTGKTFIPVSEENFTLTKNTEGYSLQSKQAQKIVVDGKTSEINVVLEYSTEFFLKKVNIQDLTSNSNLEIEYTNWGNFNNNMFPQNIKIIIKDKKTKQIFIENTNFEFLKMETPYSVPDNYTKTSIK